MAGKMEWNLERYREFNDRLARKVAADMGKEKPALESFVERGQDAQRAIDAKLLVHRLHTLAVLVSSQEGLDVRERAAIIRELNELADDVEGALS